MKINKIMNEWDIEALEKYIKAFWNREISNFSIKLTGNSEEYNDIEIYANWLVPILMKFLEENKEQNINLLNKKDE